MLNTSNITPKKPCASPFQFAQARVLLREAIEVLKDGIDRDSQEDYYGRCKEVRKMISDIKAFLENTPKERSE